jgi:hypothetical protein
MARQVVLALALSLALAGTAAGAGGQSGKLVTYVHDGGFTGDHDSLTVFRNGRAVSSNGPFVLSTRRRLGLQRALVAARFATLRSQYVPIEPITDGYADHVTYAGRSVGVTQGASPPARLKRVLTLLADILARKR